MAKKVEGLLPIDPIGAFQKVKEDYLRYFTTMYKFRENRYDYLNERMSQVLTSRDNLYKEPYCELQPEYASDGKTLREVLRERNIIDDKDFLNIYSEFIETGLMNYPPYNHQVEMLEKAFRDKHNVVITSGTGSGKTESFFLPLFASLIKEAYQWSRNGTPDYNANWHDRDCYNNAYQRIGENRPAALRALIMYPMNALVDDQISRLRKAIDSYDIRDFFEEKLNGHRIFFGRYNSDTIAHKSLDQVRQYADGGQGAMEDVATQLNGIVDKSKSLSLKYQARWENDPNKKDALFIAPVYPDDTLNRNMYSGEMLTRWDMQECPPDILITNFSMLQIALMRTSESHLFEQTRQYYHDNPDAVFHLIIDELHLYRGTSGTEIAYLIRMFLDRIGVPPTVVDPQTSRRVPNKRLRIMASSASLGSDEETTDFLEQFFGVYYEDKDAGEKAFEIQPGSDYVPVVDNGIMVDYSKFAAFAELDEDGVLRYINEDDNYRNNIKETFLRSVKYTSIADYLRAKSDKIYSDFVRALTIEYVEGNGNNATRRVPKSLTYLRDHLMVKIGDKNIREKAMRGFLIFRADSEVNGYVKDPRNKCKFPRIRFHQFFKYVEGLWGELLPSTDTITLNENEVQPRVIGELMYKPDPMVRTRDGHSHKVLELLRCEYCGELYIGGNRLSDDHGFYMTLNSPDLTKIPNRNPTPMVQNKRYPDYAIFWPTDERYNTAQRFNAVNSSGQTAFNAVGYQGMWEECYLNPYDGSVKSRNDVNLIANPGLIHGYVYKLERYQRMTTLKSSIMALPCTCPHCKKDYSQRLYTKSPIRSFRSGISRSNQILSKELMYQLPENDRKLIGFSDSRQDAADQAHGIAVEHFRDMVRLLFMQIVSESQNTQELEWVKEDIIQSHRRGISKAVIIQRHINNNAALSQAIKEALTTLINNDDFTGVENFIVDNSVFSLSDIIWRNGILDGKLLNKLISLGINPLGVDYADQFDKKGMDDVLWASNYDFILNRQHTDTTKWSIHFESRNIRNSLQATIFQNCFGRYMGLNTESVGLGYITVSNPERSTHYQQLVNLLRPVNINAHEFLDAFVRILGDFFRYEDPEGRPLSPIESYNGQHGFREDWKNYVRSIDINENLLGHTLHSVIHDIFGDVKLDISQLSFKKKNPTDTYYKCKKCGRVHLHWGGGHCTNTNCCRTFNDAITGQVQELHNNNFISYDIEIEPRNACRIHTEELTGQTDDQTTRLLDFKGIILGDDEEKAREIDMLNVTTTMEVGVDIGSLLAVYQGNMPPTRYNYQQRVGRGGRSGQPFSTAFTFCRGRSHDLHYYENATDEITGGLPAAPKLSVKSPVGMFNPSIVKRVITKHILKEAFASIYPNGSGDISDTHGEFGEVYSWFVSVRDELSTWLNGNQGSSAINDAIDLYMSQYNSDDDKYFVRNWIQTNLIPNIDSAVDTSDSIGLAEAIAEAGLMPMYGMPSGLRVLYHGYKNGKERTIDRPIDQSITEFAPGAIKTKDHGFYQSAGLTCSFKTAQMENDETTVVPSWDALEKSYRMQVDGNTLEIQNIEKANGAIQDPDIHLVVPKAFRCSRIYGNKGKKNENTDSRSNFTQTTIWAKPTAQSENKQIGNLNISYWNCAKDAKPHIWYVNDNNGEYFEGNRQFLYERKRTGRARNEGNYANEPHFIKGNIEGREKALVEKAPNFMVTDIDTNRGSNNNYHIAKKSDNNDDPILEKIALGAKKVTEMVCLTIRQFPTNLCLNVNEGYAPAIKSAFYSAATLIQRYFADVQDIQPEEIEISDLKIDPHTGVPSIYLSDQLQNGSGYVGMLLKDKDPVHNPGVSWLEFILYDIVKGENAQSRYIQSIFRHKDICETSCACCLCSYRNSGFHHILDWRLGVDLIKLMLNNTYDMGFSHLGATPYSDLPVLLNLAGNKVVDATNNTYLKIENDKYYIDSTTPNAFGGVDNNRERVIHPLWNLQNLAEGDVSGFQNFFELFRTNYEKNRHISPINQNPINSGMLFD